MMSVSRSVAQAASAPSPLGAEDGSERELAGGSDDRRPGAGVGQLRDHQAGFVDDDRLNLHPVSTGNRDLVRNRGTLHRDAPDAAERQSAQEEVEAVQKPEGEDQVAGVDSYPADARQVAGQRRAEVDRTS